MTSVEPVEYIRQAKVNARQKKINDLSAEYQSLKEQTKTSQFRLREDSITDDEDEADKAKALELDRIFDDLIDQLDELLESDP
jgi:hypothetical protein